MNRFKTKNKIFLTIIVFVIVFAVGAVIKTKAADTRGWSWGGGTEVDGVVPAEDGTNTNVRWISMNSKNCDIDGDGVMDRINVGLGTGDATAPVGCPADGAVVASYGIVIPESGNVTGNAWSGGDSSGPGLGYINFQPTSPPTLGCNPSPCPVTGVVRSGNNLNGWARFEQISAAGANAGGWEGWIKMSGIASNGSSYGVMVNADGTLSGCIPSTKTGCAWSNELGWIDFSRASVITPKVFDVNLSLDRIACDTNDPANSGCTSFSVTLTADRNPEPASTTSGNITYEFSCGENGASDGNYNTPNTSQSHTCNYSGITSSVSSINVSVTATQESISDTEPRIVAIYRCGNNSKEGTIEECDAGTSNGVCPASCSSTCKNNSCSINNKWIEVAP